MIIRQDIAEFITAVELFSNRKLNYPKEVGEILQIALQTGMTGEFEELIFQAKFLIRTQEVLKQISNDMERTKNLSIEFDSCLTKSIDLFRILIGRAAADVTQNFSDNFFSLETGSLDRLMKLYYDLSWIKNWQIDGNPMPYQTKSKIISITGKNEELQIDERHQNNQMIKSLSRIQKSAALAFILIVFFLLLDPPVTALGWMLSLGISALLAYIMMNIIFLTRTKNSD